MKILVGLGNPGQNHERNRHNIGFMAIERIAKDSGLTNWRNRHQGLTAEGRLGNSPVVLLKPQTYMNRSGQSVGEAMRYLRLSSADIIVFHDELDLAPGKVRSKVGGGHAGHNGLRSIHQHVGAEFVRVRLGIGHPGEKHLVTSYVLGNFFKSDTEWLSDLMDAIGACAPVLVENGVGEFQNCIGRRRQPKPPTTAVRDKPTELETTRAQPERRSGPFHSLINLLTGKGPNRD